MGGRHGLAPGRGGIEGDDWHSFTTSPAIRRRVNKLSSLVGRPVSLAPAGVAIRHGDLNFLRADFDRAQALGLNTYRFSLEWSRIQPRKPANNPPQASDFDETALEYYSRVIDEIRRRGMEPLITLNHMTLPLWVLDPPRESSILSAVGLPTAVEDGPFKASLRGWENAATVTAFVQFTDFVVRRYRDRVTYWLTLNEPVGSMIGVGYVGGIWPPGFNLDGGRAKTAYFNLIKAHVRAYNKIKEIDPDSRVGFAHAMLHAKVTSVSAPGGVHDAARNQFDYFYNWHMLNAVVNGSVDVNITAGTYRLTGTMQNGTIQGQIRQSTPNGPVELPWEAKKIVSPLPF